MPGFVLYGLLAFSILFLSLFYFFRAKKNPDLFQQAAVFGFVLYMIAELFSPVFRHQYYTVQWFPIVLAGFLLLRDSKNSVFLLLISGLILNISNLTWLFMRHTLGEFCWLAAMLILLFAIPALTVSINRDELKEITPPATAV